MDCDEWIADLRTRREDLWLRQGELDLKVTKVAGEKRKRKTTDEAEISSSQPTKRTKISVNVPVLKKTPSKAASKSIKIHKDATCVKATPKKTTCLNNRDAVTICASNVLSPLVQQRPEYSPLKKHFKPLRDQGNFLPGSPISPAYSALTQETPSSRSGRFGTNKHVAVTPTPHQNFQTKAPSTNLKTSRLAYTHDSESVPMQQWTPSMGLDGAQDLEDEGQAQEELLPSTVKKLSFLNANVDGEEDMPLYQRSPQSLMRTLFAIKNSSLR